MSSPCPSVSSPLRERDLSALAKTLRKLLCSDLLDDGGEEEVVDRLLDLALPPGALKLTVTPTPLPESRPSDLSQPALLDRPSAPTAGVLALGHHRSTSWWSPGSLPLMATAEGLLGGVTVFGSINSSRREAMATMAMEEIASGRGVFMMDARGDGFLLSQAFAQAQSCHRLQDLRMVNLVDQQMSHSLDLLGELDASELLRWMDLVLFQPVCESLLSTHADLSETAIRTQFDRLWSTLAPSLVQWRDAGCGLLTPGHVAGQLMEAGVESFSRHYRIPKACRAANKAYLDHLRQESSESTLSRLVMDACAKHLEAFAPYAKIFEPASGFDMGLVASMESGHAVIVSAPGHEQCSWKERTVCSAILATQALACARAPTASGFRGLLVVDEFDWASSEPVALFLATAARHAGMGLVCGALGYQGNAGVRHVLAQSRIKAFMDAQAPAETTYLFRKTPGSSALSITNQAAWQAHVVGDSQLFSGIEMNRRPAAPRLQVFLPKAWYAPSPSPTPLVMPVDCDRLCRVLRERLKGVPPAAYRKLAWCQETIARMFGFAHSHEAKVRVHKT